ncbi:predicted protein [Sclerotinia sclerotiorum 1980 UF-70]|uniref:Uncharacterized protein n=1 Tax=Sclerotinia sclerotiorum (strain ATCC 18683 / 1980 / Ss-1) TaxID=665079 RepID=A7FA14_SCLS1|nr:predicted protein [Sclerotinia sclerotiorum 1980 UF-70]EDO00575.1 predicted protein [Sclerotinia sclerotiorum 1980 UF-70]
MEFVIGGELAAVSRNGGKGGCGVASRDDRNERVARAF